VNLAEPRAQYAVEVLGAMFPGSTVHPAAGKNDRRTFALAPSGRRPRLLVPTSPRDAAATALRAYGGRLTRQARLSYGLVASAVATAGPGLLRSRLTVSGPAAGQLPGIDAYLAEALGREVSIAAHLTPSRANRKPVIQALAAGERHPLAFAKMAVSPLTTRLVEQEATALAALADRSLEHLVVPTVVHHGSFAGNAVLTLKPLPTWLPGRSPTLADVAAATREVAALAGVGRARLADSGYWSRAQQQAHDLPATSSADRLRRCVEQVTTGLGDVDVTFTASHGDWSPWNMWLNGDRLLVWDWERFERETPAGFDLLHFRLNERFIRGGRRRDEAGFRLLADAPDVLAYSGFGDAPLHTVLLYLIHLGLRFEADGQAIAGPPLGRLETWLLPALEAGLSDPAMTKRT
jgi:hypothetical protein